MAVLQALVQNSAHVEVVGVVTQPDKPAGRGNELRAPAVKIYAVAEQIPCIQPVKVRDGALAAWLRGQQADIAVVAAYGRILTQEVLEAPRLGCVNLHASLLPRWRGASPIARAIAAGDRETGVCLMQMDAGLDTGDVMAQAVVEIGDIDTTPTLEAKLATRAGALLMGHWPALLARRLPCVPQPTVGVTFAPLLERAEAKLDFHKPATQLHAQVRAMQPWPGATLAFAGAPAEEWKVGATGLAWRAEPAEVGVICGFERQVVWVGCGVGRLGIAELQRPGKAKAAAADVLRGVRLGLGARLVA